MTEPARELTELPFFFGEEGRRLFGFLHLPSHGADAGILFCHALAEEKLWSHRVYVNFAREAAARGMWVFRFDFRGEGDSDLPFEQSTIASRIEDVHTAVEEFHRRAKGLRRVVLVGHRLGATVAALAAAQLGVQVAGLAIWDPIYDGKGYFQQLLRSNLTTQMATEGKVVRNREALVAAMLDGEPVVVDGYGLTAGLYDGIVSGDWTGLPAVFTRPVLLAEVPRGDQSAPSAIAQGLKADYGCIHCALTPDPPFWREARQFHQRAPAMTAATLRWIEELPP